MEMMVDKKDLYKEVLIVLSNFNKDIIKKIPDNIFIKLVEMAADSKKEVNIDLNKKLEEQDVSQECKEMIALIYYQYIADSDEKKELIKIWKENDCK